MKSQIRERVEDTAIPELPEVGKFQISNTLRPMPMEVHRNELEFLLLNSGYKKIWVEEHCYEMSGGDLLVVFPGQRHGAEDYVQNRTTLTYALVAVPTELDSFCMLEENERRVLWQELKNLRGKKFRVSGTVSRAMETLYNSVNTGKPLEHAEMRVNLMRFLFHVLKEADSIGAPLPADIAEVIRYIRESRGEMPDIAKLAAQARLSESRFKQKFKQATGIPPAEFIVREKIDQAKVILRETRQTVTSIAMELGFSSSQHFSVLFKKYVGESPIQYRKNVN